MEGVKYVQAGGISSVFLIDVFMPMVTPCFYSLSFRNREVAVLHNSVPVLVDFIRQVSREPEVFRPSRIRISRMHRHGTILIKFRASDKALNLERNSSQTPWCGYLVSRGLNP